MGKSRKAIMAASDVAVFQRYGLRLEKDITSARQLLNQGMSHEAAAARVKERNGG